MNRGALERRLALAETATAGVLDRRAETGRAALAAIGVDLAALSDDALHRLERLASEWPRELGDIPAGVVRACLGAPE
jgi:hypothetical protein